VLNWKSWRQLRRSDAGVVPRSLLAVIAESLPRKIASKVTSVGSSTVLRLTSSVIAVSISAELQVDLFEPAIHELGAGEPLHVGGPVGRRQQEW
jgi:hypothetical protein